MRSSIWEVDPSGDRRPTRLTRSAPGESVGAFLRDGSLLFTSSRPDTDAAADDDESEETSRLWRLAPSGGEAHILVSAAGGIEDVVTARDADVLAFSAGVFPGTTSLAADKEKQQARKKAGVEALLFESYPIRRWDHYLGPRDRHLFAAAAVEGEERIDAPTDLTVDAGNALVETGYSITPDGDTVVTSWLDTSEITHPRERLLAIDRATRERRFLTPEGDFSYAAPACSPDGHWVVAVAYLHGPAGRTAERHAVAGRPRLGRGPRAHARARPVAAASGVGSRFERRALHGRPAGRSCAAPCRARHRSRHAPLERGRPFRDLPHARRLADLRAALELRAAAARRPTRRTRREPGAAGRPVVRRVGRPATAGPAGAAGDDGVRRHRRSLVADGAARRLGATIRCRSSCGSTAVPSPPGTRGTGAGTRTCSRPADTPCCCRIRGFRPATARRRSRAAGAAGARSRTRT